MFRSASGNPMRRGRSEYRQATPRRPQPPRDWSHPTGFQFSEVEVGHIYDGVVTRAVPSFGAFVDFGAVRDGLLRMPARYRSGFRRGMEVSNMRVVYCDVDRERVTLELDEDSLLDSRPSSRPRSSSWMSDSRSEGRGRSMSRTRPRSRSFSRPPRDDLQHPEGVPIEDVRVGEVIYDGVVTGAGRFGIFVNIGAVKDGRLSLPRGYTRLLKCGDVIPDCTVEAVNVDLQHVTLRVDDPEALVEKLDAERVPVEEFEVGMTVDGFINASNFHGIFVNIRAVKDARLKVPMRVRNQLAEGRYMESMVITAINTAKQHITLALADDLLQVEPSQPPPLLRKERAGSFSEPKIQPATFQRPRAPTPGPLAIVPKARQSLGPDAFTQPKVTPRMPKPPLPRLAPAPVAQVLKSVAPVAWPPQPRHPELEAVEDLLPLTSFQLGDLVDGTVLRTEKNGVVVDIGATARGLLQVHEDLRCQFLERDIVQGMKVEEIDQSEKLIILSMEDPELSVDSEGSDRGAARRSSQELPRGLTPPVLNRAKAKARQQRPMPTEIQRSRTKAAPPLPFNDARLKARDKLKNARPE